MSCSITCRLPPVFLTLISIQILAENVAEAVGFRDPELIPINREQDAHLYS